MPPSPKQITTYAADGLAQLTSQFSRARPSSVPVPTLVSVNYTVTDAAGGTAVTVTGTDLTGASALTLGGTACTSVVVVNATTITFVTPAKTAGLNDLVVTTAGGMGTLTNAIRAWDPTVPSGLRAWLRADKGVTGSPVTAWADQSGNGYSWTAAGAASPTTGTAIAGKATLHFDGSAMKMSSTATVANLTSASAWTSFAVFSYAGATVTQGFTYNNPGIIYDYTSGEWGLSSSTTKFLAGVYDGADKNAQTTITTSTAYIATARLSGGTIYANVNAGTDATAASGNIASSVGVVTIGHSFTATGNYFLGDLAEVFSYNVDIGATQIGYAQQYMRSRYPGIF